MQTITAKYAGPCAKCGVEIPAWTKANFHNHKLYHVKCPTVPPPDDGPHRVIELYAAAVHDIAARLRDLKNDIDGLGVQK